MIFTLTKVIFVSLGNVLVGVLKVPPLTLPFNLSTIIFLAASYQLSSVRVTLNPALPLPQEAPSHAVDWGRAAEAVVKGYGQVFMR